LKFLRELAFPSIAVFFALIVGSIFIVLIDGSPIETYRLLIGSAFTWPAGIGYTMFLATPLIFTGLAVAVAFRAGLLNIGAEGQLYVAAFATAWTGIVLANLPRVVLLPLCVFAAIAAGAVWGAIPGVLKARFGSHEVINTIMMNFVAVALVSYFTQYHYRTPGDPILQSSPISTSAYLARLGEFIPGLPQRIPVNVSFLLALLCAGLVYVFLWHTKWGYEIRATGSNPEAAEYDERQPPAVVLADQSSKEAAADRPHVYACLVQSHRTRPRIAAVIVADERHRRGVIEGFPEPFRGTPEKQMTKFPGCDRRNADETPRLQSAENRGPSRDTIDDHASERCAQTVNPRKGRAEQSELHGGQVHLALEKRKH